MIAEADRGAALVLAAAITAVALPATRGRPFARLVAVWLGAVWLVTSGLGARLLAAWLLPAGCIAARFVPCLRASTIVRSTWVSRAFRICRVAPLPRWPIAPPAWVTALVVMGLLPIVGAGRRIPHAGFRHPGIPHTGRANRLGLVRMPGFAAAARQIPATLSRRMVIALIVTAGRGRTCRGSGSHSFRLPLAFATLASLRPLASAPVGRRGAMQIHRTLLDYWHGHDRLRQIMRRLADRRCRSTALGPAPGLTALGPLRPLRTPASLASLRPAAAFATFFCAAT